MMTFDDDILMTQKLKYSFIYYLWLELKLFIDEFTNSS